MTSKSSLNEMQHVSNSLDHLLSFHIEEKDTKHKKESVKLSVPIYHSHFLTYTLNMLHITIQSCMSIQMHLELSKH